ncbi:hypothetical protein LJC24_01670 [Desulfococcaceae bacterium OttesenSCG-928-F15]|nr:hypothetical protein [Desulfococcaceae bacterium OttesenSCG-928-F15]
MEILPKIFTFLFFICVVLSAASVFTPKLALPFREKTKQKGVVFWAAIGLISFILQGFV